MLRSIATCRWVVGVMAALACVACGARDRVPASRGAVVLADDFGDSVRAGAASRIVSLNPVSTELLVTAGAAGRLVGRSHWDLYPPGAERVADLGNGIGPNVEAIVGVRPDLVILYASTANRRAAVTLNAAGIRTLSIRTDRLADLVRLAAAYAAVTADSSVIAVVDSVRRSVEAVAALPHSPTARTVVWRIGEPPLFVAGKGSFLSELIEAAGAANAFADVADPSPQVSVEEVARRRPDVVLTGPQGAERLRADPAWRAVEAVRRGRVLVVDTALVGRPGVRLGEAARHVRRLIAGDSAR